MRPATPGWRAMPSIAWPASRPIPMPAPMVARPAPTPAPSKPQAPVYSRVKPPVACSSAKIECIVIPLSTIVICHARDLPIAIRQRDAQRNVPTELSSPLGRIRTRSEQSSASVRTLANQSDEDTGQKREDKRLQKCHEQLEQRDAERQQYRHRHQQPRAEGENEADQRQQHDVARRHVGEEANRQRQRLRELSEDFD